MFAKLTEKLDGFLEMGVPFYDCIVLQNGKCIYRHSNGYTDVANKKGVTGKERYNVYSCSKLITCVAALQLWEKGAFSLGDKLSDYMPEFGEMTVQTSDGVHPAKNPILIKHLFSMTAGFGYDTGLPEIQQCQQHTNGRCPTRELIRCMAKAPLLFEPGEGWQYSFCHDVLAALVEVISGVRFSDYVKKNIFDVVDMPNSTFYRDGSELKTLVNQYMYDKATNTTKEITNDVKYFRFGSEYESGGAGCISTVDDYIKLLESLRTDEKLLKQSTVALMSTNCLTDKQMQMYFSAKTSGYGLGQRCKKIGSTYFSWGGAAGAYYHVDKTLNLTVFLATQVLKHDDYQAVKSTIGPIIEECCKK